MTAPVVIYILRKFPFRLMKRQKARRRAVAFPGLAGFADDVSFSLPEIN